MAWPRLHATANTSFAGACVWLGVVGQTSRSRRCGRWTLGNAGRGSRWRCRSGAAACGVSTARRSASGGLDARAGQRSTRQQVLVRCDTGHAVNPGERGARTENRGPPARTLRSATGAVDQEMGL